MKWYWKLLIALAVLLIAAILSIDSIASKYVNSNIEKIQSQVEEHYRFEYKSVKVSIIQKRIVLKDFELESIVDSVNSTNKLHLHLKKLILHFGSYAEILSNGRLHVIKAQLKSPSIDFGLKKELSNENSDDSSLDSQPKDEADTLSTYDIEKFTNAIVFDEIVINDGIADVYHLEKPDKKLIHVEDLDLLVTKLNVDLTKNTISDMLKVDDLKLYFSKVKTNEIEKHVLRVDKVNFELREKKLKIKGVRFLNRDKPKVFARKNKYRSPWFDLAIKEISIDVNPWHIYNKGVLYIPKIEIDEALVEIYNDITLELTSNKKLLPPGDIRKIPIPIMLDSLVVTNSRLKYLHKDKSKKPGMFGLGDINVTAKNITNIDYKVEQDPILNLVVNAKLWDSGDLYANFNIDLQNSKDIVNVKGWVKNMPLKKAEYMIKPLYDVEIFSGHLDYLAYDLMMNDDIGRGNLKFDYRDLKIDIKKLQKQNDLDKNGNEKSSKFLNFIVNEAVLTNNVPGETKNYIDEGTMIFDRTQNKPIFDLYWHSIQVGIMDVVIADAFYQAEANYSKKVTKQEKEEVKDTSEEESNKKKKKRKKKNKN